MKLPLIKQIHRFIQENDRDYVHEALEVLEDLSDAPTLNDDELNVLGELISNMHGALEVDNAVQTGTPVKEALNGFMQRVMGSIEPV